MTVVVSSISRTRGSRHTILSLLVEELAEMY